MVDLAIFFGSTRTSHIQKLDDFGSEI